MVREDVRFRLRAVKQHIDGSVRTEEICHVFGISERTLREWCRRHREEGAEGLRYRSRRPEKSPNQTRAWIERRILRMRRRHPAWGAKRIHAYLGRMGVTVHWTTVHRVLKRNGMMVRIRKRPEPSKRFQRQHVDSLWQLDVYEFRIADVGRVYVFNILDDRSRYLVMSRAYKRKRAAEAANCLWWALRSGRRPKAVYVDNGTCFIAKDFKRFCERQEIRIIYGRPYNPKGRGKLERFHGALFRELISQKRFRSLSHFRREMWLFRRSYNKERLHGGIEWKTPAEVYNDKKLMRKGAIKR
jgi:transposase InsO family protein